MLRALEVAVVSGVHGGGAVGLEHVVLLEVLPVHGGHGALDALGAVADAVDGCDGLAEAAAVGGACDVADEWGHVDLVGVTGEGLVIPEPLRGRCVSGCWLIMRGGKSLPGAEALVVRAGGEVRGVEGLELARGTVVHDGEDDKVDRLNGSVIADIGDGHRASGDIGPVGGMQF